jgi:hypothetical protein
MADVTPENDDVKIEVLFTDGKKQKIFEAVRTDLEESTKNTSEKYPDDDHAVFGDTFEKLAKEESHETHEELGKQGIIRELIEEMYSEAEIILGMGSEKPSRPDGVSVGFNSKGELVISEILEFKTSLTALVEGIENDQPNHTLETIENLVDVLNRLISGEEISELKAFNKLNQEETQEREVALLKLQGKIKESLDVSDRVSLSDELVYHVVLTAWEAGIELDDDHIQQKNGKNVKTIMTNSIFSKKDVHEVLKYITKRNQEKQNKKLDLEAEAEAD